MIVVKATHFHVHERNELYMQLTSCYTNPNILIAPATMPPTYNQKCLKPSNAVFGTYITHNIAQNSAN